jgi:hypothetical protein
MCYRYFYHCAWNAVGDELEYADEVTWEKYIAAGTFRKIIQKINLNKLLNF